MTASASICRSMPALLRPGSQGVRRADGPARGPARASTSTVDAWHDSGNPRRLGRGQEHAAPHPRHPRPARRGHACAVRGRRRRSASRDASWRASARARSASCSSSITCCPSSRARGERDDAAADRAAGPMPTARERAPSALERGRARRSAARTARRALGRRGAAGRGGARAGRPSPSSCSPTSRRATSIRRSADGAPRAPRRRWRASGHQTFVVVTHNERLAARRGPRA